MFFTVIITARNPTLFHRSLRSRGLQNTVVLANEVGLEVLIRAILRNCCSRMASLSNEILPELAQQHIQSEITSSDAGGKHQ